MLVGGAGQDISAELDLALDRVQVDNQAEIDWSLVGLLAPFDGIAIGHRTHSP